MTRTELLRRKEVQITLDHEMESVFIRKSVLRDNEAFTHVGDFGKHHYHCNSPARKKGYSIKHLYDIRKGDRVRR